MSTIPAALTRPTTPRLDTGHGIAGRFHWAVLGLGVIGEVADVTMAKATLDVVMNVNETMSLVVAGAITVSATLAAALVGMEARNKSKIGLAGAVTGWAGLGLGMFMLRYHAAALLGDAATTAPAADKAMAFVMLTLYVAAGAAIAWAGAALFNRWQLQYHAGQHQQHAAEKELPELEALYARITQHLDNINQDVRDYETLHRNALEAVDNRESLLKSYARDRIALALANPAATPIVRAPHES